MMLWLVLTIMTWAAAMWLAVPFLRRLDPPHEAAASDIAVYRDQLQEVERDVREGRIDGAQAETARLEIKRRILAAGGPPQAAKAGLSGRERSFALVGSTGILVLGSVMLYAVTGSPELASTGAAQRGAAALPPQHPPLEGLATADGAGAAGGDEEPSPAGLPTVEEMTQRLAARLAQNPGDTDGWRTLGWSYLNIGRFTEAAGAYAKAIALDPGNAEFRGGRIEALVGAADGAVTAEAQAAIAETLKRDPKNIRARYFDGLAREQAGDKAAALAEWTGLLKESGADEHSADSSADHSTDRSTDRSTDSWASELRTRVSALRRDMGLGRDLGLDGPAVGDVPRLAAPVPRLVAPERPAAQAALEPRAAGKGPGAQDVQAAEAMAPADRTAMIRNMVDGLASRLEQSPRDADGWIRLIRSRTVLGEGDLAKQALARSLAVFADDAPQRDRIAAAAQELGVAQ
jgi:cytochrome c-type biogenesis protein CcmH